MDVNGLRDSLKTFFTSQRSLLLPMLILALGVHAALLALPIPSSEATKEAEDKKNPITINQIPTEQPPKTASAPTGTVDVPAMAMPSSDTTSTSESSSTTDTSTRRTANQATDSSPTSSIASKSAFSPAATKSSIYHSSTARSTETATPATPETPANSEPASDTSNSATPTPVASANPSTNSVASNAFADFPHYQPSEADCYGLGFGENCRVVESKEISQVTEFFKQELTAKGFTTELVKDDPDRKVFKVVKGDKTLFLNIWQGKDKVSYLLSRVVLKQSPEDIKTESGR